MEGFNIAEDKHFGNIFNIAILENAVKIDEKWKW